MNGLQNLSDFLSQTGTTAIEQVLFDLKEIINTEKDKLYPLVFWDLSTMKFNTQIRKQRRVFTLNVYAVQHYIPEEESPTDTKIKAWDTLYDAMIAYLEYLVSIEGDYSFTLLGLDDLDVTLYDKGMISVDEEVGIGFEIQIEAYC